ncbi:MAG: hypothetical protein COC19_03030 [SAR86 cluster bacterium]|uniref:Uncharacterized protein n=1 Tax=SAR86 cluster bacterium TaxID=2030880 RepID=A0A2A4MQL3_9GAMM|nr:MAG: hypothetical protein COC19_03030 [SAR86 cluster bacterium]
MFSAAIELDTIAALTEVLEDQGFRVTVNSLPIPASIHSPTIIFPPLVQDMSRVDTIQAAMQNAGFEQVRLIYNTQGNHFYSTENIGVYLLSADSPLPERNLDSTALGGSDASKISHVYYSECADSESELNLFPGGVVLLEEFVWDERNEREHSIIYDGQWQEIDAAIVLDLYDDGELYFNIVEQTGSDRYGEFKGLTLVNQLKNAELNHCNYTYLDYEDY